MSEIMDAAYQVAMIGVAALAFIAFAKVFVAHVPIPFVKDVVAIV